MLFCSATFFKKSSNIILGFIYCTELNCLTQVPFYFENTWFSADGLYIVLVVVLVLFFICYLSVSCSCVSFPLLTLLLWLFNCLVFNSHFLFYFDSQLFLVSVLSFTSLVSSVYDCFVCLFLNVKFSLKNLQLSETIKGHKHCKCLKMILRYGGKMRSHHSLFFTMNFLQTFWDSEQF